MCLTRWMNTEMVWAFINFGKSDFKDDLYIYQTESNAAVVCIVTYNKRPLRQHLNNLHIIHLTEFMCYNYSPSWYTFDVIKKDRIVFTCEDLIGDFHGRCNHVKIKIDLTCVFQLTSSILITQVQESPYIAQAHHIACCCQNVFPFLPPLFSLFHFGFHLSVMF